MPGRSPICRQISSQPQAGLSSCNLRGTLPQGGAEHANFHLTKGAATPVSSSAVRDRGCFLGNRQPTSCRMCRKKCVHHWQHMQAHGHGTPSQCATADAIEFAQQRRRYPCGVLCRHLEVAVQLMHVEFAQQRRRNPCGDLCRHLEVAIQDMIGAVLHRCLSSIRDRAVTDCAGCLCRVH